MRRSALRLAYCLLLLVALDSHRVLSEPELNAALLLKTMRQLLVTKHNCLWERDPSEETPFSRPFAFCNNRVRGASASHIFQIQREKENLLRVKCFTAQIKSQITQRHLFLGARSQHLGGGW